jgi:DTW domain-containing protein YfiP
MEESFILVTWDRRDLCSFDWGQAGLGPVISSRYRISSTHPFEANRCTLHMGQVALQSADAERAVHRIKQWRGAYTEEQREEEYGIRTDRITAHNHR